MSMSIITMFAQYGASLVPQIILLVGCFVYVSRTRRMDGYIMLGGSIGGFVATLLSAASMVYVVQNSMSGGGSGSRIHFLMSGIHLLHIICSIIFAVGFLIAMRAASARAGTSSPGVTGT